MNAPLSAPRAAPLVVPTAARPFSSDGAVRFDGIAKTYGARGDRGMVAALHDVTLDVPLGGILGVIGPSGAGKSTLIRLVNGLERPTAGRLTLFGLDVTHLAEPDWRALRRDTGMIFQHFNLLSARTAAQNVALPLEIIGTPADRIRARVAELLDLVGLSDKAGRYPAELSGGQKQRVGIARALATAPKLLLCDEATSALDPETTLGVLALLRRLNRDLGLTILLITHEIAVVRDLCDQVAVIEAGRIVEQGDAFDLLTRPGNPVTARMVEAVTGVEPPPALAAALVPAGPRRVIRLRWTGAQAQAALAPRLHGLYGAEYQIAAARIDRIGERPYGGLILIVPAAAPVPPDAEELGYVA